MHTQILHPTSTSNPPPPDPVQEDHFRAPHSFDILRQVAGKAGFRNGLGKKFKVVNYRDWMSDGHSSSRHNTSKLRRNPVVIFAKPGKEAGRKVVDYYYTWKGKTGTRPLKGSNRRSYFLQEEFGKDLSKLTEALDKVAKESKSKKTTSDPLKIGGNPSRTKANGSASSGTAQSLPLGIDNSLSKLRIMNPDPSRTARSSGSSSRKSQSTKPTPLSNVDSPWSSSETLQNSLSDSMSTGVHQTYPATSCGSESSCSSSTEALIVLLDDDDDGDGDESSVNLSRGPSWHGLEKRASSRAFHLGYNPHVPCVDEEDCCSDDSYSEQECCDPDYCVSASPCNAADSSLSTPVQPIYHMPTIPFTSPLLVPGFVPSPVPHRSVALPPPGFIPLSTRSMQDIIRESRSDVHGQQLLDNYAANSPYAVRPSLYFSPHSSGYVPLPHTPSAQMSPLVLHHQHLNMPHQASY